MARPDKGSLEAAAIEWERDDPRFARGLATGRPCRPREYRHRTTWLLLAGALALLAAGLALQHALPLSAGVILSALAVRLYDQRRSGCSGARSGREQGGPAPGHRTADGAGRPRG